MPVLLLPGGVPSGVDTDSVPILLLLLHGGPGVSGTVWTEAVADGLTLSDALTVTVIPPVGPTVWPQALADVLTLSDVLNTTIARPQPVEAGWVSAPRLAQTLWTPTYGTCACGLGHASPQGCNAVTGLDIGESGDPGDPDAALSLVDALAVLHLPGFVTVPTIKATGVMICEGFEDDSGDVNNLWTSGGPGYAFDSVPTFRPGHTGGRAVRAQQAEGVGTASKNGFGVPEPVAGTPVDTYIHLYWQFDNLTFSPLSDPGYPAVYTLNRPSQIAWFWTSVECSFVVGIRHVLTTTFPGPVSVDESRFFVGQAWGIDGRGAEADGTHRPISGQPYRIEVRCHAETPASGGWATTSISASFFLGDATTPVETISLPLRYGSAYRNEFIWGNSVSGGGVATVRYWFDDIMVRSTPFSGPYGIFLARPASNATVQLTPVGVGTNASAVDDFPGPHDGVSTYVQSTVTNQSDLYGIQWASPQTPPSGAVLKASNVVIAGSRLGSNGFWVVLLRALGVTRQGAAWMAPPTGTYGFNKIVYQDGVIDDWIGATTESVAAFQIGVAQTQLGGPGPGGEVRCTACGANFALAY